MNKTLTLIFIVLALGLLIYNVTMLDFNNLFAGDSIIAWIGIVAPLCAIALVLILNTSKKIERLKN